MSVKIEKIKNTYEEIVEQHYCDICWKHTHNIINGTHIDNFDKGEIQIEINTHNINDFKSFETSDICTTCANKKYNELIKLLEQSGMYRYII